MAAARTHLTYANLMSTIAVVGVLGGTAWAVVNVGPNDISDHAIHIRHINKGAVTGPKIRSDAVTSDKVLDGSLLGADFAAGQLPAGPKGETGAPGKIGDTGPGSQFTTASVAASEPTTSATFTDLATPGPSVQVTVPSSGLIEIYARADIALSGGPNMGQVALAEDGSPMTAQFKCPDPTADPASILMAFATGTFSTPCAGSLPGLPGSLLIRTSPGQHTYALKYLNKFGGTSTFANRYLAVAPRP